MEDHPRPHLRGPPILIFHPGRTGAFLSFSSGASSEAQLPKALQRGHLADLLASMDLDLRCGLPLVTKGKKPRGEC